MVKQLQPTVSIPALLVLQSEAWGQLAVRLFEELRRQAGLRPHNIDKDRAWHWTEQSQRGEQQADEDIAAGRVRIFATRG